MSENLGLGKLITTKQSRDAIHIAVAPVKAGEMLHAGQRIAVKDGVAKGSNDGIGLVDPFLKVVVYPDQEFWLWLDPGSITSLRHHWEHPGLAESKLENKSDDKERSEKWLRDLADHIDKGYGEMMRYAKDALESRRKNQWPEYLTGDCEMEGEVTPEEFWDHYAIVTGDIAAPEHRGNFFSCACT